MRFIGSLEYWCRSLQDVNYHICISISDAKQDKTNCGRILIVSSIVRGRNNRKSLFHGRASNFIRLKRSFKASILTRLFFLWIGCTAHALLTPAKIGQWSQYLWFKRSEDLLFQWTTISNCEVGYDIKGQFQSHGASCLTLIFEREV